MTNNQSKSEKDIIQELITKSEEEFEKKITYIGAGALLLSLTLLEKIFKLQDSEGMVYLILSWILLIFSLLINFISHLVSKIHLRKAEQEIDSSTEIVARLKNHKRKLIQMESLNWTSAISLVLGIVLVLVFASVNTINTHERTNFPKDDTLMIKIVNQNQLVMKPTTNEQPGKKERQNEGYTYPRPQIEPEKKGYTTPTPRQDPVPTIPSTDPPNTKEKGR